MRPVVNRDTCIGCGLCEETCPEVFKLGDDNVAYVLAPSPGHEQYDCIQEAAEICPVEAISVVRE